jgi:hypothetical protein
MDVEGSGDLADGLPLTQAEDQPLAEGCSVTNNNDLIDITREIPVNITT